MSTSVSPHPDWETAQREARKLLRALQLNDAPAAERYHPFEVLGLSFHARLSDAQYIVARRYGFKSWASLKAHALAHQMDQARRLEIFS